jgi:hypothetical protein
MTFDDISYIADFQVPNGYKGLTFTNLYATSPILYYGPSGYNGYKGGTISPLNVAYNGYATPATIFSPVGQEISLASMWVTPAWNYNVTLVIRRFDTSGVKVAPDFTTVLLSPYTPKQISFNSTFVARIVISCSGGTDARLFVFPPGVAASTDYYYSVVVIDNIAFFVRPTVI